eukprot:gene2642-4095_t
MEDALVPYESLKQEIGASVRTSNELMKHLQAAIGRFHEAMRHGVKLAPVAEQVVTRLTEACDTFARCKQDIHDLIGTFNNLSQAAQKLRSKVGEFMVA